MGPLLFRLLGLVAYIFFSLWRFVHLFGPWMAVSHPWNQGPSHGFFGHEMCDKGMQLSMELLPSMKKASASMVRVQQYSRLYRYRVTELKACNSRLC